MLRAKKPKVVSEIMSSPVRSLPVGTSGRTALGKMQEWRLKHVVIVSGDGRLAGVLSERDLREAQPSRQLVSEEEMRAKALALLKVEDLMASQPISASEQLSIGTALRKMRQHKIGALPVVDARGVPIGVVTGYDVISLAIDLLGEE